MKLIAFALLLSLPFYETILAQRIEVVYPQKNQRIAVVDSTFIFGNTKPGADLYINGLKVAVHDEGGWLAFCDVSPGPFTFRIMAINETDTARLDWPVIVGAPEAAIPAMKYIPRAPSPSSQSLYFVGDEFEFSFKAPPGGIAWFSIGDKAPIKMYQSVLPRRQFSGSVFEMSDAGAAAIPENNAVYAGYYRFAVSDTGKHSLVYSYQNRAEAETTVIHRFSIDTLISVIPEYPPVTGMLKGQSQIIRTGPGMGYKLLYQPPGIFVNITGMKDRYYKISLTDNISGYVNVDSILILPAGTFIPEGAVSFVTVDSIPNGIKVSADIGVKVPYEIQENLSPAKLDISFYGVTSNVDWIRYNYESPFLKVANWSQDEDHIFRLSLELADDSLWGYKPYYEDSKFVIEIRKNPARHRMFTSPIKGLKIAIDPGHSRDSGAIGPTGLTERNANLWIAYELRKMLQDKGAEVLMTRYGPEHVALYDRPKMADQWGADLLISIHNNALPDGINPFNNNGTSVYYYYSHSEGLARAIHRRMLKHTGLPDHGLYYGNLVLTRYSAVPSVLVECAFMMIPEQEALLKTDTFQRKCARAIAEGIEDFLNGE